MSAARESMKRMTTTSKNNGAVCETDYMQLIFRGNESI
jgi:hypothetical protein